MLRTSLSLTPESSFPEEEETEKLEPEKPSVRTVERIDLSYLDLNSTLYKSVPFSHNKGDIGPPVVFETQRRGEFL